MKISLEGFEGRLEQAEEKIRELKDRSFEIMESEEQKDKRSKKSQQSLRDLWDTIKWSNIHIIGEGKEREIKEMWGGGVDCLKK